MRHLVLVLAMLVAACSSGTEISTTTSTAGTIPTSTTTTQATTTTRLADCSPAPYAVGVFPERVSPVAVPAEDIALDDFTSIPGTHSTMWLDSDGALAVAIIRGSLPPEDWPGERGEVNIDGARGVAGPFADGTWVVGWFEETGERCDLYTMVFYPPVTGSEVEATLASLDRTAG